MRAPPHEMVHQGTDATGMEEWRCPLCGRHFVVRWPPNYERLVLAEGDENATHVGTKGEAGFRGVQITPTSDERAADADGGDDWRRWLRDHGINWDDPEA
jgi:hypothetical protein